MSVQPLRQYAAPVRAALRLAEEDTEPPRLLLSRLPMPVDLELYGGDDFIIAITVADEEGHPLDLEDAVVHAQARQVIGAAYAWHFRVAITDEIILTLPSAMTIRMPARLVWACRLNLGGRRTTLMEGNVTVVRGVVRGVD